LRVKSAGRFCLRISEENRNAEKERKRRTGREIEEKKGRKGEEEKKDGGITAVQESDA